MVIFAGNDYFGLSKDPRLVEAMIKTSEVYGISPASSRKGLGWNDTFEELEDQLARYFNMKDAIIFGSCYLGGLIYFNHLAKTHDIVFCDKQCHSNMIQGIQASGLEICYYQHLDVSDLAKLLAKKNCANPIIATDGMWGRSGELAPLKEIQDLAIHHNAEVLVDDAHGVFTLGNSGRGIIDLTLKSFHRITVLGSMSKGLGCFGGFLIGDKDLISGLKNNDVAVSSTTMAVPIAGACLAGINILTSNLGHRKRLNGNAEKMREILFQKKIKTVAADVPVLGLDLSSEAEAQSLSDHFIQNGIQVPYFKYASEPRLNILRVIAKSNYTTSDLDLFHETVLSFNPFPNKPERPGLSS